MHLLWVSFFRQFYAMWWIGVICLSWQPCNNILFVLLFFIQFKTNFFFIDISSFTWTKQSTKTNSFQWTTEPINQLIKKCENCTLLVWNIKNLKSSIYVNGNLLIITLSWFWMCVCLDCWLWLSTACQQVHVSK